MKTTEMAGHDLTNNANGSPSPLGSSVLRREGAAKLCGKAQFVDDLPREGVWVAGTVRADVPHARLLGVRRDDCFDWDRVVVLTAADIPGENVAPVVLRDQPSLAEDFIRYHGQPVALVAAPDQETLARALENITIDTSPLGPVFDVDEGLDAKTVIYGEDNLFRKIEITKGDVAAALRSAAVVIEGEYRTGAQEHAYLEPQGMQAERTGDGITIRGSMQCPYYLV
ncbi:MAG: molybdopterin cofactor-binding domain-containing protein, partial [Pirellulales bacterium]